MHACLDMYNCMEIMLANINKLLPVQRGSHPLYYTRNQPSTIKTIRQILALRRQGDLSDLFYFLFKKNCNQELDVHFKVCVSQYGYVGYLCVLQPNQFPTLR